MRLQSATEKALRKQLCCSALRPRARRLPLACLALALLTASQARAGDKGSPLNGPPPPWAVENPGGADARLGLGLGWLIERLDRLSITFQETASSYSYGEGDSDPFITSGDPDLLSRKFDFEWQLQGPVAQVPIALPTLGRRGPTPLYSALVLELTQADVDLEIHDRSVERLGSSFSGNGIMPGAWLDLVMPLCRRCPWFVGGGYRYRELREMEVDRSPPFEAPGFAVAADAATLSGRTQEAFLRWGYAPLASRYAPYVGVRYRSTTITVDDELRLTSEQDELRATILTRTRFESEANLAMAGVDLHLGPRLFGRAEVAYGDGETSALVKVVYLHGGPGLPPLPKEERKRQQEENRKEREQQKQERARAAEIAVEIAPRLAQIEEEFLAAWEGLTEFVVRGTVVYQNGEVEVLLDTFEARLLAALSGYDELAAMRDWVRQRFHEARQELDRLKSLDSGASGPRFAANWSAGSPGAAVRFTPYRSAARAFALAQSSPGGPSQPTGPTVDQEAADRIPHRTKSWWGQIRQIFGSNDLVISLCVRSLPVGRASFIMHPPSFPEGKKQVNTNRPLPVVWRGLYRYRVEKDGYKLVEYDRLDLVDETPTALECHLVAESSPERALPCDRLYDPIEECDSDG